MSKKLGDMRKPRGPVNQPKPGGLPPGLAGLGGDGAMPMIPGTVHLTPFEEAELKKHGWKKGDPIPVHFPTLLAAVEATKAEADRPVVPVPVGTKDLVMPAEQSFETLDPGSRGVLADALRLAAEQDKLFKATQAATVQDAGPGVNEAIRVGSNLEIVDDLFSSSNVMAPRPAAPARQAPPAAQPAAPPIPSAPTESPAAAEPPASAGAFPPLERCPHCNWDLKSADDVQYTREDQYRWLVAQEGQTRFMKEYELLGGRIKVVFRSLTAKESDMAFRQVGIDAAMFAKDMAPEGQDFHWRSLMAYRLCMGIQSVWSKAKGPQDNPTIDEWEVDREDYPAPNTKVYAVLPVVTEALFPTESLRRQIGTDFHRFSLLVEHFEARADDDPFWEAIEGRA